MTRLNFGDAKFIKTMAYSDSTVLHQKMNQDAMDYLNFQIGMILQQYYLENTTKIDKKITSEFERAGISEEEGKAAIACARRLGIDIY